MIIKFKPKDFEECLMGMPIDNWLLVDEPSFNEEQLELRHATRPKMLISHIVELDGIYEKNNALHIRGYTKFDYLLKTPDIPNTFKVVLMRAHQEVLLKHQTLGCYLSSYMFDRFLYPYLVATQSKFLLKSYMMERMMKFDQFALTGNLQFANYNEILYEIIIPKDDYTLYSFNTYEFEEISGENRFSYFCGVYLNENMIEKLDFSLMLPNKMVISLGGLNQILKSRNIVTISQFKEEIYRYCYDNIVNLRLQFKYRAFSKHLIDELIWKPLMNLYGGRDD
ncbi:MAG: hypothetical protein JXR88_09475 [Clostridia bacterium]|nr:hypothetical protein [Clostridia bacterium]